VKIGPVVLDSQKSRIDGRTCGIAIDTDASGVPAGFAHRGIRTGAATRGHTKVLRRDREISQRCSSGNSSAATRLKSVTGVAACRRSALQYICIRGDQVAATSSNCSCVNLAIVDFEVYRRTVRYCEQRAAL